MQGAEILTKFTADTSGVDKATKGLTGSFGKLTSAFTLGNLAAKGISKAIGVMSANMGDAIKRADTLNNFPKVMSNLGIGADDAQKSINKLSDKLQGLPTSLDSAANSVQRLTSKNGDVAKSTDLFLAMNNAVLAGGASADIQATAIEQMSQAYAKGKPDMMEWRTMMTAMPAQLKQVATAMGYVDADALGQALRKGSVSMDQFMSTISELNTKGVNGFKSFEEQARNSTGGIGTSITNMKTAFVRGIADMVNNLNKSLESVGGISGVLSKVGKIGEKAFKSIGKAITKIMPTVISIATWIKEHQTLVKTLVVIIGTFITVFKTISTIIAIVNGIKNAFIVLKAAIAAAGGPITLIIAGIAALVAGFIYLWNNCEAFRDFWIRLWDGIKTTVNLFVANFKEFINNAINFVKNNWKYMIGFLVNPFGTAFKLLYDKCSGFRNFINGIGSKIKGVFTSVGNAIKSVFTKVRDFVKNIFNGIKDTIVNVFNGVIDTIKKAINKVIGMVNKVIGKINGIEIAGKSPNIPKIPKLATGTNYVPEDTLAMIHEGEAVVPKKFNPYANGINNQTIGAMNTPTPSIKIVVNNNMELDPLGQVVSKIKTFSGGAKNDYNYGQGV